MQGNRGTIDAQCPILLYERLRQRLLYETLRERSVQVPNAQCPMPNAQCPMPNTQYPIPNTQFFRSPAD
ncbi:hypothetical protein [Nostoc sp.]|uniref:hypothetical protein n=1 Tax=Nostoc sp. TaxID=1180 RepID=UPI002FF92377